MLTPSEKLNLLNKTRFNYKDVMQIVGCKKTKAYDIMKIAKTSFNGQAGIFTSEIKPSALFLLLGTTIEEEIKKTKLLAGNESEEELH